MANKLAQNIKAMDAAGNIDRSNQMLDAAVHFMKRSVDRLVDVFDNQPNWLDKARFAQDYHKSIKMYLDDVEKHAKILRKELL